MDSHVILEAAAAAALALPVLGAVLFVVIASADAQWRNRLKPVRSLMRFVLALVVATGVYAAVITDCCNRYLVGLWLLTACSLTLSVWSYARIWSAVRVVADTDARIESAVERISDQHADFIADAEFLDRAPKIADLSGAVASAARERMLGSAQDAAEMSAALAADFPESTAAIDLATLCTQLRESTQRWESGALAPTQLDAAIDAQLRALTDAGIVVIADIAVGDAACDDTAATRACLDTVTNGIGNIRMHATGATEAHVRVRERRGAYQGRITDNARGEPDLQIGEGRSGGLALASTTVSRLGGELSLTRSHGLTQLSFLIPTRPSRPAGSGGDETEI